MNKKFIMLLVIAGALLTNCSSRDEHDVTNSNSQENTQKPTPPKPSTPTDERPTDQQIGQRTYAQRWKVDKDTYLENIDIAGLYNNNISNVLEGLKKSVEFATLTFDQKYYVLKDEDIKNLTITDLKYDGQHITFYTQYKNIKSTTKSSLEFNDRDFYNKKITVNSKYVSTKYMRGIYEYLPLNLGDLLNYDEKRYQINYVADSKSRSDYSNNFSIKIEIIDKKISSNSSKNTFEIDKNIEKFKTLKELADDLMIVDSGDLRKRAKEIINKNPNKTDFTKDLDGYFFNSWYNLISISLKSDPKQTLSINGNSSLHRKIFGSREHLDIYLEAPRFILTSAILEGNNLKIKIKLQQANDVTIDKAYNLTMPNIKGVNNVIPLIPGKVIDDPADIA